MVWLALLRTTASSMVHTLLTAALSLLLLAAPCSPQHQQHQQHQQQQQQQQQQAPDPMMIHVSASEREVLVGHLTSDQAQALFLTRRQRLAWTEEQYLRWGTVHSTQYTQYIRR